MYDDVANRVQRLDRRNGSWVTKGTFGRYQDARARIVRLMNTERPAQYRVIQVTANVVTVNRPIYI